MQQPTKQAVPSRVQLLRCLDVEGTLHHPLVPDLLLDAARQFDASA
jgi:hypothetical protein